MVLHIDLTDLWTRQKPLDIKNNKYWLKLKVSENKKTQQKYYDILGGIKGKKSHIHYGFDLLGNIIFDQPRDKIKKLRKTIDSSLHGKISDETKILKNTSPKINFVLVITPDAISKESKVTQFEIMEDSPK